MVKFWKIFVLAHAPPNALALAKLSPMKDVHVFQCPCQLNYIERRILMQCDFGV